MGGRRTKKARQEDGVVAAAAPDARPAALQAFEGWMRSQGITWDTDRVALRAGAPGCAHQGWAVYAQAGGIAEGDHLCNIPKDAVLSVRTTAFADMITQERLGGGLGLIVACMAERTLGSKSKWYGYFESLPAREYLPIFWSDEELELLEGTELESKAEADRQATESDYDTDVAPLADKYKLPKSQWTLESFRAAASWVASRAFYVDHYHGNSMVPLADVFNHKASVVELAEGFAVAETAGSDGSEDQDSDMEEGEEDEDEEGEEEGEEEEGEGEGAQAEEGRQDVQQGDAAQQAGSSHREHDGDGHQSKESSKQHAHHCQHGHDHDHNQECHKHGAGNNHGHDSQGEQEPQAKEATAAGQRICGGDHTRYQWQGLNLRLEIGICSTERDGKEVLEIVAASPVPAGAEVHNTYGEHGNAELVNKYGFALSRNPFNEVSVSVDMVTAAVTTALTARLSTPSTSGPGAGKAASAQASAQVSRDLRRRMRLISTQSDLLDPTSEPLLIMPGGCVSKPLLLLLYVLLAEEQQVQAWPSLQEALDQALRGALEKSDKAVTFEHAIEVASLPSTTLTPTMKHALASLLAARLQCYPSTLEQTMDAMTVRVKDPRSEHAIAVRAALQLRLSEQQLLQECLEVVQDKPQSQRRQRR